MEIAGLLDLTEGGSQGGGEDCTFLGLYRTLPEKKRPGVHYAAATTPSSINKENAAAETSSSNDNAAAASSNSNDDAAATTRSSNDDAAAATTPSNHDAAAVATPSSSSNRDKRELRRSTDSGTVRKALETWNCKGKKCGSCICVKDDTETEAEFVNDTVVKLRMSTAALKKKEIRHHIDHMLRGLRRMSDSSLQFVVAGTYARQPS